MVDNKDNGDNRTNGFEPRIIAFLCNWCSYAGSDLAGVSRLQYPANVVSIRVMCSGRVDPEFVLKALNDGADGVLIGGCHPGDCHYVAGNYKTYRRMSVLKRLLGQLGIDPGRLRLEWISAAEGVKFARTVKEFTEDVRKLGPLEAKRFLEDSEAAARMLEAKAGEAGV